MRKGWKKGKKFDKSVVVAVVVAVALRELPNNKLERH